MGDELENGLARPASSQEPQSRSASSKPDDASSEWFERQARLANREGLHARPATAVSSVANCFKSQITIRQGDVEVNAKTTIALLGLAAKGGAALAVRACGVDAEMAAAIVAAVLSSGFGETPLSEDTDPSVTDSG